ncbi:hypothetical protein [Bacteroides sp. 224]|uniref:hypothetical protein n=1 Tax=Bacteroides sp. 224 TaxID=2302936 RepID=UPI0013CFF866|nr:hypothetical protein [Bacteroides sp. 224]NDV66945.1 hypothetical protein [Bacteroides sp. 224]
MKQLFYLLIAVFCISLSACSGNKKASSDSEEEVLNIDYSKPAYFRGKVKQMEMKGYPDLGNMLLKADTMGNITTITFNTDKQVTMTYNGQGNLLTYKANAAAWMLPMFDDVFMPLWFTDMLISYYDADITFTYNNGRLSKFTDAKKGQTQAYSYDKQGRIILQKISDKKGGRFNDTSYKYDEADGKLYVSKMSQDYERYVFDAEGKLVELDINGSDIVYDDKNEVVSRKKLKWEDDEYGLFIDSVEEYTYTYDKKGNWTKREGTTQKWDSNAGAPTGKKEKLPVITRSITYYE